MKTLFTLVVFLFTVACNQAPESSLTAETNAFADNDMQLWSAPSKNNPEEQCWYVTRAANNETTQKSAHKYVKNKNSYQGDIKNNETVLISGGPVAKKTLDARIKQLSTKDNKHSKNEIMRRALIDIANGTRDADFRAAATSENLSYTHCDEPSDLKGQAVLTASL